MLRHIMRPTHHRPGPVTRVCVFTALAAAIAAMPATAQPGSKPAAGILLEDLTWQQAERVLTPDAIVVIPLGAAAKEHGPHLRLKNDFVLAEYFTRRVVAREAVVVAPTINYHFYPAFVEYPGSTSLRLETARDLVVDICRSLARFGPKRFYVLNTGVSTIRALKPAQDQLAAEAGFEDVWRVEGSNRYATAAELAYFAMGVFDFGASGVCVATGQSFPDALAGGQLAGNRYAPLLLTATGELSPATYDWFRENADLETIRSVTFLGGTAAIEPPVRTGIRDLLH